ncbi:DUF6056 family protein [Anaeroselena agilis]|uniref:DUF6056 family protein n=1 Tax=Anaeroselena agilis TaxID=3063788 RepID=A0ABU3P722_9FIRM|nr:DUF6056 family protein [Selenomonadales bacterium 4137-cl]
MGKDVVFSGKDDVLLAERENSRLTRGHMVSLAMLAGLFVYMYALNYFMPLHRDDYEYALVWNTLERLSSWPDVFRSLYIHYFQHGGRMMDFFVLDSFLLVGKEWFNPFNALLYVALMVLIYWHSQREVTLRFNPYILGLIIVFCWLGLPDWAVVNVWMTGACVYLLTAVLIFSFLLPYHFEYLGRPLIGDTRLAAAGMFLGGVAASWTIENTAATMILAVAALTWHAWRRGSLRRWMVPGLAGSLLGYALLVAAPGNFVRYGKGPKLAVHFLHLLGASFEILLGVLPVVVFLVLAWRILATAVARRRGMAIPEGGNGQGLDVASLVRVAFAALMLVSLLNGQFVASWAANALYTQVAVPLGVATDHLRNQLFRTMSGLEPVALYLVLITQIFKVAFTKLALRKRDVGAVLAQVRRREVVAAFPAGWFAAVCVALAIINNLVMLAAPSFPGRAGYGSAVFLIIGAMSLLTVPEVYEAVFGGTRKRFVVAVMALMFFPMAEATLSQHYVLHKENSARMAYVERMVAQGATHLELEPLPVRNMVLRHVYFVELNNHVSKGGFIRYYGLKDVKVR